MNALIYEKNSEKIAYFIKNCRFHKSKTGEGFDYIGDNGAAYGVKRAVFKVKFTLNDADQKKGVWNKKVGDLKAAPEFDGQAVGSRKDVDVITRKKIAEKYSDADEKKLLRNKLSGRAVPEWNNYDKFVNKVVGEGKEFKNQYFKKEQGNADLQE